MIIYSLGAYGNNGYNTAENPNGSGNNMLVPIVAGAVIVVIAVILRKKK